MRVSVGVDVAEERKGLDLVALDDRRDILERIARASVTDVVAAVMRIEPDVVCIDSPPAWAQQGKSRVAERALRSLGIQAFYAPTDPGDHPFYRWMRVGFEIYNNIADRYPRYRSGPVSGTALEVFPEASATLLAGTLCPTGHKIRFRRAVLGAHAIDDTLLSSIDAVDAALAALTGLHAVEGQFTALGDPAEGTIVVPVARLPDTALQRPLVGAASNIARSEPVGVSPTISSDQSRTKSRSVRGTPCSSAQSSPLAKSSPRLHDWVARLAEQIPRGRWTTYGTIAKIIEDDPDAPFKPAAISVANELSKDPGIPNAHRILNAKNRIPEGYPYPPEQIKGEGIGFMNGRADSCKKWPTPGS